MSAFRHSLRSHALPAAPRLAASLWARKKGPDFGRSVSLIRRKVTEATSIEHEHSGGLDLYRTHPQSRSMSRLDLPLMATEPELQVERELACRCDWAAAEHRGLFRGGFGVPRGVQNTRPLSKAACDPPSSATLRRRLFFKFSGGEIATRLAGLRQLGVRRGSPAPGSDSDSDSESVLRVTARSLEMK